jgi:hypothetical protein
LARLVHAARTYGKSDPIDALAVARAALRQPDLPVAQLDGPARRVRLLIDHRKDLVAERTRHINRLRWHLHEIDPTWDPPARSLVRYNIAAHVHRETPRVRCLLCLDTSLADVLKFDTPSDTLCSTRDGLTQQLHVVRLGETGEMDPEGSVQVRFELGVRPGELPHDSLSVAGALDRDRPARRQCRAVQGDRKADMSAAVAYGAHHKVLFERRVGLRSRPAPANCRPSRRSR